VPELFSTERIMGAHCGYTHYMVKMTRPARNLLMWQKAMPARG